MPETTDPLKRKSSLFKPKALTVTETQGLKDFQSIFLGNSGKISLLQMGNLNILITIDI